MALMVQPPAGGLDGVRVTVIGLGLMGGSVAKALKRGTGAYVTALDVDEALLKQALEEGAIDRACRDAGEALKAADLTVVCLYPGAAVRFLVDNMALFQPGSVVTDICGVKQPVIDSVLPALRPDVDFVPGHPMAGRERSGYRYSDGAIFDRCNYILTPLDRNNEYSVDLVKRFAGALGAGAIVLAGPEEHDEMIAYTSQLPHALAVAYVLEANQRNPLPFSAGSYRDVSRVAAINGPMWAELFVQNSEALLKEIGALREGLGRIEGYLSAGDSRGLVEYLRAAARAKEEGL